MASTYTTATCTVATTRSRAFTTRAVIQCLPRAFTIRAMITRERLQNCTRFTREYSLQGTRKYVVTHEYNYSPVVTHEHNYSPVVTREHYL